MSMLFACIDLYLEAKEKQPDFPMPPFSISNINSLTSAAASSDERTPTTRRFLEAPETARLTMSSEIRLSSETSGFRRATVE